MILARSLVFCVLRVPSEFVSMHALARVHACGYAFRLFLFIFRLQVSDDFSPFFTLHLHFTCVFLHVYFPVTKLIDSNKLPHLLFYGPPGTGKTSTILACARKLYGADFKMMVLEVGGRVLFVSPYHMICVVCAEPHPESGLPPEN